MSAKMSARPMVNVFEESVCVNPRSAVLRVPWRLRAAKTATVTEIVSTRNAFAIKVGLVRHVTRRSSVIQKIAVDTVDV